MLLLPHIPVVLACPYCSMFNLFQFQFRDPGDAKWGVLIVTSALAMPFLLGVVGFRLGPKRVVTAGARWRYAGLFFMGWIIMMVTEPHATNFGTFLMHWMYLPIVLQFNFFMVPAWSFPPLLLLSALAIPAVCCFYASKWLLGVDRVIVWKGQQTGSGAESPPPADQSSNSAMAMPDSPAVE